MWVSILLGLVVLVLIVVAKLTLSTDLATYSLDEPSSLQLALVGGGILAAFGLVKRLRDKRTPTILAAPRAEDRDSQEVEPASEPTRRVA